MLTVLANVPRALLYGLILSLLVVAGYQWYNAGQKKDEYETNLQLKTSELLDAKGELQKSGEIVLSLRNDTTNYGIKYRKLISDEIDNNREIQKQIDDAKRANANRPGSYGRNGVLDALSKNSLLRQSGKPDDSRPNH